MPKTTYIMKCACVHEQQDKKYGRQNRLFNLTKKPNGNSTVARCTVCGHEKSIL